MEIKQIRMGIVGAGTWGRTHASIYAEHLFADPVAICDMNEARAREIADEFGIRKVYTDYHDMAADEEIDAVAIVTPDFAHADIACAMADAKKDILIEKPLATTKEDIATVNSQILYAYYVLKNKQNNSTIDEYEKYQTNFI